MNNNRQSQIFRSIINIQYGPDILRKMRWLDRLTYKMAHATTSLTFLMECRDKNIIPNGLRIKDPCNIGRSQILIQRIERALLRNLINSTKYRKYQTRMEISNIVTNLRNTMNLDHWNQFDRSVDVRYNQLWRQVLSKGLNYAIASKKQPSEDIKTGLECAAHLLPQNKKEEFRLEITTYTELDS